MASFSFPLSECNLFIGNFAFLDSTPVVTLDSVDRMAACMCFAGSTRTQYFEAPPFFVPAAGITVWVVGAFGVIFRRSFIVDVHKNRDSAICGVVEYRSH